MCRTPDYRGSWELKPVAFWLWNRGRQAESLSELLSMPHFFSFCFFGGIWTPGKQYFKVLFPTEVSFLFSFKILFTVRVGGWVMCGCEGGQYSGVDSSVFTWVLRIELMPSGFATCAFAH